MSLLIAKVGGSLFALPELGPALLRWIERQPEERILLVAGGGDFVEALRKYQPLHGLSETESHWLAVRALGISARMLAAMLGGWPIVDRPGGERRAILDCPAFLERDESASDSLPKSWSVTTDSIAARAAMQFDSSRLVLLKSRSGFHGADWRREAEQGYVDEHFPHIAPCCQFPIECVDFRNGLAE